MLNLKRPMTDNASNLEALSRAKLNVALISCLHVLRTQERRLRAFRPHAFLIDPGCSAISSNRAFQLLACGPHCWHPGAASDHLDHGFCIRLQEGAEKLPKLLTESVSH